MGHDLAAAASMGQLRSVLRPNAFEGHGPADVLDRLDRLVQDLEMAQLATAVYGRLVLDGAGGLLLFANAGHLPPLLRHPDGGTQLLEGARSPLIGAPLPTRGPRPDAAVTLPPGSTLLLYTDGLVEDRHRPLDEGLQQLQQAAGSAPSGDPEQLCEHLLATLVQHPPEDDIAVLALRVPRTDPASG